MDRITIRISEEDKQRWEDYKNNTPEYDSLTSLIKGTVEREIQRGDAEEANPLYQFSNVLEEIETNRSNLQEILDRLDKMESKQAETSDIAKLDKDLRQFLGEKDE